MEEEVDPVCSPAFLAQHPLNEPGDIASQMLIHDLSVDPNTGFASWTDWFERASVAVSGSKRGLRQQLSRCSPSRGRRPGRCPGSKRPRLR